VKIKLDENLPHDLKSLLRSYGHDVVDVPEEQLSGAEDPPVLAAATTEGRLLMTFDTDFADIRHYPVGSHGGIVVFRLADQRWAELAKAVQKLLTAMSLEELAGSLAIVEATRIRYRRRK